MDTGALASPRRGWRDWLEVAAPRSRGQARVQDLWRLWLAYRHHPLGLAGLAVIVLLVIAAVAAPLLTSYDPLAQDMAARLQSPSAAHWFGTDEFGRDVYARTLYGARTTLRIVALVAVFIAPIGLLVGVFAGSVRGIADEVLMRVTDIFLAFPSLVLALGFAAALGPGITNAIIAISLTAWPPVARLARAEALVIGRTDYIAAVRLTGAGTARVVVRHIIPMCLPSVIVRVSLNMASIILTAAGLGFLGLGAQPPQSEWGAMVATGRQFMLDSPWVVVVPCVAIALVSLAFNLAGDALRDVLDPKLRQ